MQFVLYTEKTVAECLTAINERMHLKETSTRPALDGWVEKGGAFSISLSAPVVGRFTRHTALKGKIERENGVTVIRGSVPGGVSRNGQIVIYVALALVALTIIGGGNLLIGLLMIGFAAFLRIPLQGDYLNSTALLDEIQKALKAKSAPPKNTAETKASASKSSTTRAAVKSTSAARAATTRTASKSTASRSTTTRPASKASPAPKSTTRAVPKPKPAAPRQPTLDMDEFPSTSIDGESVT